MPLRAACRDQNPGLLFFFKAKQKERAFLLQGVLRTLGWTQAGGIILLCDLLVAGCLGRWPRPSHFSLSN